MASTNPHRQRRRWQTGCIPPILSWDGWRAIELRSGKTTSFLKWKRKWLIGTSNSGRLTKDFLIRNFQQSTDLFSELLRPRRALRRNEPTRGATSEDSPAPTVTSDEDAISHS